MEISEELSKPYSAEITVIAREGVEVDPGSILGEEATLLVHLGLGDVRYLHGIVASFDHWDAGAGPDRHRYRARIAPRLWKLEHRVQSRIFQNMTVPEIVMKVLDEGRGDLRLPRPLRGQRGRRRRGGERRGGGEGPRPDPARGGALRCDTKSKTTPARGGGSRSSPSRTGLATASRIIGPTAISSSM